VISSFQWELCGEKNTATLPLLHGMLPLSMPEYFTEPWHATRVMAEVKVTQRAL
jgi:hypothetical protein